jgi:uncharacterized coiled-coil protein SlyX
VKVSISLESISSYKVLTEIVFSKERQLNTLNATIEQFCAKEESLQSEVGSDLVSQLTVEEQTTVDKLNDTIEQITQELKEIIKKRVEVRILINIKKTNFL